MSRAIKPTVSPLGNRVYVSASLWEQLFGQYAPGWGEAIRDHKAQPSPMVTVQPKSAPLRHQSVKTSEVLARWNEGDITRAMALGPVLKASSSFESGKNVKATNEQLRGLFRCGGASEVWPKVMRDVLDTHGWLERQRNGSSINGVKTPSNYRLTIPAGLFAAMSVDPEMPLPAGDGTAELCLEVIDMLELNGALPPYTVSTAVHAPEAEVAPF